MDNLPDRNHPEHESGKLDREEIGRLADKTGLWAVSTGTTVGIPTICGSSVVTAQASGPLGSGSLALKRPGRSEARH